MFVNSSFGRSIDLLKKGMDISDLRHRVIADNLANVETPNFKRSDVTYESFLKRALDSEKQELPFQTKVTREGHLPFHIPIDYRSVKAEIIPDHLTESKANGNNVDMEQEIASGVKNQFRYALMTSAMSHQFNQINMVLR